MSRERTLINTHTLRLSSFGPKSWSLSLMEWKDEQNNDFLPALMLVLKPNVCTRQLEMDFTLGDTAQGQWTQWERCVNHSSNDQEWLVVWMVTLASAQISSVITMTDCCVFSFTALTCRRHFTAGTWIHWLTTKTTLRTMWESAAGTWTGMFY